MKDITKHFKTQALYTLKLKIERVDCNYKLKNAARYIVFPVSKFKFINILSMEKFYVSKYSKTYFYD
jgi:hypothetical protein